MSGLLSGVWPNASRFVCLIALATAACGDAAPDEEGDGSGQEEQEERLPPAFVELDSQRISLSAQETAELVFAVSDLRVDTRVELDGRASLPGSSAPAWLDAIAGELHVPLGGALLTGAHTLALSHEVGGELLRSVQLSVEIEASSPGALVASIGADPVGTGSGIVVHGQGIDVVLALLDVELEQAVVRAGSWGKEGFALELPGLAPATGSAAGASVDFSIASPPGARWVVASWLDAAREHAYARVVAIDDPGDPLAEPGPVLTLWSVDELEQVERLGPHELLRLDGLAWLERTWVLGVEARRDAEQPSPGDHMLVTRYFTASGDPAAALVLRGPGNSDLDLVGPGRSWTGGFAQPALDLRADLAFARRLRVADNGLPQLEQEQRPNAGLVPGESVWFGSADAALGGRHVFALMLEADPDAPAALWVQRYDRWREPDTSGDGDGEPLPPSGAGAELIELASVPSGPPVLTAVDGVPTLLVPLGADTEVLALRSSGAQTLVETVAGLRCDAIGVASPGDDGVGDTLPLACLREEMLWLGALGED